jgi:hypothetical protein
VGAETISVQQRPRLAGGRLDNDSVAVPTGDPAGYGALEPPGITTRRIQHNDCSAGGPICRVAGCGGCQDSKRQDSKRQGNERQGNERQGNERKACERNVCERQVC